MQTLREKIAKEGWPKDGDFGEGVEYMQKKVLALLDAHVAESEGYFEGWYKNLGVIYHSYEKAAMKFGYQAAIATIAGKG